MNLLDKSLYPIIFQRKSTRKYSTDPVSSELLANLQEFIANTTPLITSEKAAFEIQSHKGSMMKIAAYSKSEAASRINMAFMLQQMDLFLQKNGVGSLWNATIRATTKEYQGLPYGISLIFGIARDRPLRSDSTQFDRKKPAEISDKLGLPFIEAVRLAPSARNRQPWHLVCEDNSIHFYCSQGNLIDNTLLRNLHWIDIGIAVCHAVLALCQNDISFEAVIKENMPEHSGYNYCISLELPAKSG